MKIVECVALAVVGLVFYTFLNVIIRRLVAQVRSREDYDEDVDGKMTKAEKEAFEVRRQEEAGKLKISLKDTRKEYGIRFYILAALGVLLGALDGFVHGLTPEGIIYFIFFAVLTAIAFIDMDTMEIPPVLNLIILILGVPAIWLMPEVTLVQRLIGLVCVSGFMLILTLLVNGAFGGGDIKLMAAAGFLLGWKAIVTSFFIGIFVGAAIGIVLMARKKKGGKEHMPFGPSLCIGLVVACLTGGTLIDWYLGIAKQMMHSTQY